MKFALTVILIIACTVLHAQYSDSAHYYVGLQSTGTANITSNSKTYVFSNVLKAGVRKKDIALNFTNSWLYGEAQKKLTNQDLSSVLDFNLYKTLPHFYYWGLATYTSSYSLKINNQAQAGAGVAYNILDRKEAHLNLSDGLLYENSDINLADTIRDVYSTVRNSLRLSFRFQVWDAVTISSTSFLQNSLQLQSDYIIKSTATVTVKIKKWFSLSTSYTYNRFNRTGKENTLMSYGLMLERYF